MAELIGRLLWCRLGWHDGYRKGRYGVKCRRCGAYGRRGYDMATGRESVEWL